MFDESLLGGRLGLGRTAAVYDYGDNCILKILSSENAEYDAKHEFECSKAAFDAGVRVPRPYACGTVRGSWGIIQEKIKGESLLRVLMRNTDRCVEDCLVREFAQLHASIHAVKATGLALQSLGEKLKWSIDRARGLSEAERARILERISKESEGEFLCHCDYHPDNVMVTARGQVCIDWNDAAYGNPLYDVARTCLVFRARTCPPYMNEEQKAQLNSLRERIGKSYEKHYADATGCDLPKLELWIGVAAASRLFFEPEESFEEMLRFARQLL